MTSNGGRCHHFSDSYFGQACERPLLALSERMQERPWRGRCVLEGAKPGWRSLLRVVRGCRTAWRACPTRLPARFAFLYRPPKPLFKPDYEICGPSASALTTPQPRTARSKRPGGASSRCIGTFAICADSGRVAVRNSFSATNLETGRSLALVQLREGRPTLFETSTSMVLVPGQIRRRTGRASKHLVRRLRREVERSFHFTAQTSSGAGD
jgi:hypothetical protein